MCGRLHVAWCEVWASCVTLRWDWSPSAWREEAPPIRPHPSPHLWIAQRPEAVVVLLPCRVPQAQVDGLPCWVVRFVCVRSLVVGTKPHRTLT